MHEIYGEIVDSNLKWPNRIDKVANSVCNGLLMLRVLKDCVSTDVLVTVYYANIQSHLNYGVSIWGNSTSAKRLFVLQKTSIEQYVVS